jgi:ubiquinone/menaquinone biosynthesis C-methylase UbiE
MSISSPNNEHQRFNQWSETYEHSITQWLLFDRVHRKVINSLPADFIPKGILDIGCGTGRLLRRLHARWPDARLVGIDLAEGMLAQARQLTADATFYQAPAEQIPLEDAWLDLVCSTMSFHHWSNHVMGVREAFRVLRQGGIFALADTNVGHGHPLTRRQVGDLFQSTGFHIQIQSSLLPFLTVTIGVKP